MVGVWPRKRDVRSKVTCERYETKKNDISIASTRRWSGIFETQAVTCTRVCEALAVPNIRVLRGRRCSEMGREARSGWYPELELTW